MWFLCWDGDVFWILYFFHLLLLLLFLNYVLFSLNFYEKKAFKEGGDFHSRTAIGMYAEIKKEIEEGKVLLEWDRS